MKGGSGNLMEGSKWSELWVVKSYNYCNVQIKLASDISMEKNEQMYNFISLVSHELLMASGFISTGLSWMWELYLLTLSMSLDTFKWVNTSKVSSTFLHEQLTTQYFLGIEFSYLLSTITFNTSTIVACIY